MTPPDGLTVADIQAVVARIRETDLAYTSGAFLLPIDPYWLSTPRRRGILWRRLAALLEADATD